MRFLFVVLVLAFVSAFPAAASAQARRDAARRDTAAARTRAKRSEATKTTRGRSRGTEHARGDASTSRPRPDSVGHPNDGRLVGGKRLDTSQPHLRLVPAYARSDVRWGLPSLVDMVDRAARAVAEKYPGSRLDVGDLSRKNGGEVGRHNSHESGRDADLGFYVVDAKGRQVHGHGFIQIRPDLTANGWPGARFDVARNWLLVERMLSDPKAVVSHVFIAEPLRQALLAHARKIGAPRRIQNRAAIVLMQPTSSLPHDDHMHVRISCPRDAFDRCVELAKNAPWRAKTKVAKGTKLPSRTSAHAKNAAPPSRRRAGPAPSRAPATLSSTAEADADAFEVKDLLDDAGLLKITD